MLRLFPQSSSLTMSSAPRPFFSVQKWNNLLKKGCWQHILMRRHDGEHFCSMLSFFFLSMHSNCWYYHDSQSSHSVFWAQYVQWHAYVFTTTSHTPALFYLPLVLSPLSLPLFLALSLFCTLIQIHQMWSCDHKGHNWLPFQCASTCCSVTQNNFKIKTWPS